MKNFLVIIFFFIASLSYSQVFKDFYWFRDGAGTTLTDAIGASANGTLAGASLPTWNSNGYLTFVGGNGSTGGNYNRVGFTVTNFNHAFNATFSYIVIFRTIETDGQIEQLYANANANAAGSENFGLSATYIGRNYYKDVNNHAKTGVSTPTYNDGKWHIFTVTYASNVLTCQIDGASAYVQTTNTNFDSNLYSANGKTILGAIYYHTTTNYLYDFSGDICRFANCSTTLTVGQIEDTVDEFNLML